MLLETFYGNDKRIKVMFFFKKDHIYVIIPKEKHLKATYSTSITFKTVIKKGTKLQSCQTSTDMETA